MARGILYHVPSHSTREVLVIFGALFSSDPGDIQQTIDALVRDQIRVRIIGLAAQVAVCKEISLRTNYGDESAYGVILNDAHFKDLLNESTAPLAMNSLATQNASTLVKWDFHPEFRKLHRLSAHVIPRLHAEAIFALVATLKSAHCLPSARAVN